MFGVPEVSIVAPVRVEGAWVVAAEKKEDAPSAKTLRYTIGKRGTVLADFDYFREMVNKTLNDSRGWPRAGVIFEEVSSGGNFAIYLQEPAIFDTYAGCDSSLSCRSGNEVMLNDERWRVGTDHWGTTGLSMDDYRRLIINHEVGHWLDHRHVNTPCSSTEELAPLMIESSIRDTCAPNIWPLENELWHRR